MNRRYSIVIAILLWVIASILVVSLAFKEKESYESSLSVTQNGALPKLLVAHAEFQKLIPKKEEILTFKYQQELPGTSEELINEIEGTQHNVLLKVEEAEDLGTRNYNSLENDIREFGELLKDFAEVAAEKGFIDVGIIGKMRDAIHPIEDSARKYEDSELLILWYELRRREKDYIERSVRSDYTVEYEDLLDKAISSLNIYVNELQAGDTTTVPVEMESYLEGQMKKYEREIDNLKETLSNFYKYDKEIDGKFNEIEQTFQREQKELLDKLDPKDNFLLRLITLTFLLAIIPAFLILFFMKQSSERKVSERKLLSQEDMLSKQLIKEKELANRIKERDDQIHNIAFKILDYSSIKELVRNVWPLIRNVIGEDTIFAIYLVNEKNNSLLDCLWGDTNVNELIFKESQRNIKRDKTKASVKCLLTTPFIHIDNIDNVGSEYDPQEETKVFPRQRKSFLYQRLGFGNKYPLGVVSFQSYHANAFNEYDEGTLKVIATYLSYAIEVKEQFHTISKLGISVLNQTNVDDLLKTVFSEISHLVDRPEAISLTIGVYDRANDALNFKGISYLEEEIVIRERGTDQLNKMNEPSVLCFNEGKDIRIPDTEDEASTIYSVDKSLRNYKSLNYFPLYYRDQLKLGVLGVHTLSKDLFSERDFTIIKLISIFISEILFNLQKDTITPAWAELLGNLYTQDKIDQIIDILKSSGLEPAFVTMDEFAIKDADYLIIRTRYHELQRKIRTGVIDYTREEIDRNKITADLIAWLSSKSQS